MHVQVRDGVGAISVSCRYFYKNGSCAHSMVTSEKCVGATNCDIFAEIEKSNCESEDNITGTNCEYNLANGMYCKKYQKFFCPGKDFCENTADYIRAFDAHRKKQRGGENGHNI